MCDTFIILKNNSMLILRRIRKILKKDIIFQDNLRAKPISNIFGLERGTPIDRYYIEKFLERYNQCISGDLLEISESSYSKQFGTNVSSYGILSYDNSNRKATILGDLTKPETLPDNKIDCFICTQTLNFIYDVPNAIEGCYKLLKPNGSLLCTVSGLSQISRYDMNRWGDYWRFTDLSIKILMEKTFGKNNVEVATYGNILAAKAFLDGVAIEDLPDISLLDQKDPDYQVTIAVRAIKK